jgi:hypothetical protein
VDGGKQLRHVIFISLLLPSAARQTQTHQFCILPQRESCYGIDCVRYVSVASALVGCFFAHEEETVVSSRGSLHWTLASDLLQLSLGPAVGLHTTFFGLVAFSAFFAASSLGTLACLSSVGAIRIINGLSRSRRAQPTETQEWPTPTAAIRYRNPGTTWREQLSAVQCLLDTPCPSPS